MVDWTEVRIAISVSAAFEKCIQNIHYITDEHSKYTIDRNSSNTKLSSSIQDNLCYTII